MMKYSTFENEDPPKVELQEKGDATKTYTMDEAVEKLGYGRFQIRFALFAGFSWMADAMEMMVLSVLGPTLGCEWGISHSEQALITTLCFVGMSVGSVVFGTIADIFGRKASLILSTSLAFYFGLLSAVSPLFVWIIITRSLVGFAIGGCAQTVTIYSEVLPSSTRGRNLILIDLFWAVGSVMEILLAWLIIPRLGWRIWLALSGFPLLLFVLLSKFLRESPRHSLTSGDYSEAVTTLQKMASQNKRNMPEGKLVGGKQENRGRLVDLFSKQYLVSSLLQFLVWLASAFAYYGLALFSTELVNAGSVCSLNDLDIGGGIGHCMLECKRLNKEDYLDLVQTTAAEIPGLLITAIAIDKIGRKPTIAIELFIFAIACFGLLICVSRAWMVVLLMIARASVAACFQAAYVYTSELYPTHMRGVGLATCSAFGRLGAMVTPFISQVLLNISVRAALIVYAVTTIVGGIAALLLPVETKGKSM